MIDSATLLAAEVVGTSRFVMRFVSRVSGTNVQFLISFSS
jgi:hypothetical protein